MNTKLTMKIALTVRDLVVPSWVSDFFGGLTDGRKKNMRTAQHNPIEPTVQNGTPNPPMLYRADPMAGPGK